MTVSSSATVTAALDIDLNDAVTVGAHVASANNPYVDENGDTYVDDAGDSYTDGIYYATADRDITLATSITSAA